MFVPSSEEIEKKRELSKVWFFDWSYETKTAFFNFDIPAENFSLSTVNVRSKFSRIWKRNRNFENVFFTKNVPLDTQNAVLRNISNIFSHGSKKVSLQVMSLLKPTSQRELI